jgi:hemerythrin-like metal-binding protein/putative nucleotidyltransferase with HDIG domain
MGNFDIFPWNENFNTSLEEIDQQHQILVKLLNQLASHVAFKSEVESLEEIFRELTDYTTYHFQHEEAIWSKYLSGDPIEVAHKQMHKSFIDMVVDKSKNISSADQDAIIEELLSYLTRWLATHILETDRYMAAVVQYERAGLSIDEAKKSATASVSGNTKSLIDLILSIYESLSTNTLKLMRELNTRKSREEQISCYAAQLESVFMKVVGLATTMSEMRDPYTVGHEKRVANLAVAIAQEMGLVKHVIEGIRVGASLHDVGKISIPAEILGKPVKLSAIEYEMIKTHSAAGYDILKDVVFPWPVDKIALQHHERLDGSGYPNGLRGNEILLEARIVAVADVVEAMNSHRPYRPGLGINAALDEIMRGRGTLYDPDVVDVCIKLIKEKGFEF